MTYYMKNREKLLAKKKEYLNRTDVKERLSARTRKRQRIGMWTGPYTDDAVAVVKTALEIKGYKVTLDEKKQMSIL